MSRYWMTHTVDREREKNSRGLPLWVQIIAGPMSFSEANVLLEDFESEKHEVRSSFFATPEEELDQMRRLGIYMISPDASPAEVTAVRRRLIGKENEPPPAVPAPDCVAYDTLRLVAGVLKDGVIYSPSGQPLGHIERDDSKPLRHYRLYKRVLHLADTYPARDDPQVALLHYAGAVSGLGYLTPDGIMHRRSVPGREMGFAGMVLPLEADPIARVALGATLIDLF